jgi:NTP pyrophosphatase (non-canonical NTP hydrolase)
MSNKKPVTVYIDDEKQGVELAVFDAMRREVSALNTAKGWRNNGTTYAEYVALLHSEVSEMLEAWRQWKETDATKPISEQDVRDGTFPKPEGIGSEMADTLIRLLDMADVFGIDLYREYARKMTYNWTRPYRHGGRTL